MLPAAKASREDLPSDGRPGADRAAGERAPGEDAAAAESLGAEAAAAAARAVCGDSRVPEIRTALEQLLAEPEWEAVATSGEGEEIILVRGTTDWVLRFPRDECGWPLDAPCFLERWCPARRGHVGGASGARAPQLVDRIAWHDSHGLALTGAVDALSDRRLLVSGYSGRLALGRLQPALGFVIGIASGEYRTGQRLLEADGQHAVIIWRDGDDVRRQRIFLGGDSPTPADWHGGHSEWWKVPGQLWPLIKLNGACWDSRRSEVPHTHAYLSGPCDHHSAPARGFGIVRLCIADGTSELVHRTFSVCGAVFHIPGTPNLLVAGQERLWALDVDSRLETAVGGSAHPGPAWDLRCTTPVYRSDGLEHVPVYCQFSAFSVDVAARRAAVQWNSQAGDGGLCVRAIMLPPSIFPAPRCDQRCGCANRAAPPDVATATATASSPSEGTRAAAGAR